IVHRDRGASGIVLDVYVSRGADRDEHLLTIRREQDVSGPMLVIAAGGKLYKFFGIACSLRLSCLIRETHDRIGVGYIEPALMKRHPERLRKLVRPDKAFLRHTVLVLIAQDDDRICTRIGYEDI